MRSCPILKVSPKPPFGKRPSRILPLLIVISAAWTGLGASTEEPEAPKILGRCTVAQLDAEPFSEWFRSGYHEYTPNAEVLERLRAVKTRDVQISVFFGTWCGDSRRELPRLLKLLQAMEIPDDRIELIGLDRTAAATKRSPGGEEQGLEIYRVPTVIVRRGGTEVGRIVEHPVLSLERDLLAILGEGSYQPAYASYPVVRGWLKQGLLTDPNVSPRGLAGKVRHLVTGETELAAPARVMLLRGDTVEAVKLFEVNCAIHRDSSICYERLAGALHEAGDPERARKAAERALRLNDDPDRVEALVELIGKAE